MHYQWKKKLIRISLWPAQVLLTAKKAASIEEQAQSSWYFAAFYLKQHESNRMDEKNLYKSSDPFDCSR